MQTEDIARLRQLETTVRKYVEALDAEERDFEDKVAALRPGEKAPVLEFGASERLLEEIRLLLAESEQEPRRPD